MIASAMFPHRRRPREGFVTVELHADVSRFVDAMARADRATSDLRENVEALTYRGKIAHQAFLARMWLDEQMNDWCDRLGFDRDVRHHVTYRHIPDRARSLLGELYEPDGVEVWWNHESQILFTWLPEGHPDRVPGRPLRVRDYPDAGTAYAEALVTGGVL